MTDKPLSERLPDGRYAVNPDAIQWDDIRRFKEELNKGQSIYEDGGGFFARCIRALMGTPLPADAEVVPYRRALESMLRDTRKPHST